MAAVIAMDPPIDEYTLEVEGDAAARVTKDFQRACEAGLAKGAEVIIPGDGVLNEFVYRRKITRIRDATVMDALGVLFRYAAFMAGARSSIGLDISRVRSFAKPSQAALDHARAFAGVKLLDENDFSSGGRG